MSWGVYGAHTERNDQDKSRERPQEKCKCFIISNLSNIFFRLFQKKNEFCIFLWTIALKLNSPPSVSSRLATQSYKGCEKQSLLGTDGQTKVRTSVAVKDADRVAVDGDSVAMEDRERG